MSAANIDEQADFMLDMGFVWKSSQALEEPTGMACSLRSIENEHKWRWVGTYFYTSLEIDFPLEMMVD